MRCVCLLLIAVALFAGTSRMDAADISVRALEDQKAALLIVEGNLTVDDIGSFRTKVVSFSLGLVVLHSDGGNFGAGIEIGRTIRLRNFATWVPSGGRCASACAAAWLGGTKRLMGKDAMVGFHAAYRVEDGKPAESGAANALLGGYLSQIGLSDRAIVFITSASPSSMRWLSFADAERIGIDVEAFDVGDKNKSAGQPSSSASSSTALRQQALLFIQSHYRTLSRTPAVPLSAFGPAYADTVRYFGQQLSREQVLAQVGRFFARWPMRQYAPQGDIAIDCNEEAATCEVRGRIKFTSESTERNEQAVGTATFEYSLSFRAPGRPPEITAEGGALLERKVQALAPRISDGNW